MPNFWSEDGFILRQTKNLKERDIRWVSINGDDLAPYTQQIYQGGEWVDMFPRLDDATGLIKNADLPTDVSLLDEDGKVPNDSLELLAESGTVPNAKLSEDVPLLQEDGTLSEDVIPFRMFPAFDVEKTIKTGDESNSTTTLVAAAEMAVPVTSAKHCRFVARILYAAESNVGARFTVNGSPATVITYMSRYPLTATTETVNHCHTYQQPPTANVSTPSTLYNLAIIEGVLLPLFSGYIWVEFASAGGDDITMLAGSHLYTEQYYAAS